MNEEPATTNHETISIRETLRTALSVGQGLEGRTWRFMQAQPDAKIPDVMTEMDVGRNSATYAMLVVKALETGEVPLRNHYAADAVAKRLEQFARRHADRLLPDATSYILDLKTKSEQAADAHRSANIERASAATRNMERHRVAGIYLYTLPHYLRHPIQPSNDPDSSDKTLLKVGMSEVDARGRVRQQAVTGLPEPPVLLRVFTCGDRPMAEVEATMHRLLGAFDHNPNRLRGAGKEWFLTSLQALDELASVLELTTEFANVDED